LLTPSDFVVSTTDKMIVKNLESVTLKTDILGKIVANNYFSGKGSQALPYKAFQIYFRNHLCW
jgi:hypothetical protein